MLDKVLGGRASESLLTFLKVVGNHGRLDCLRQIRREARKYFNDLRNRMEVSVATAQPLTDELRGRIYDTLRASLGRDVELDATVDEALIGGMIVRVGDTVYDSSLRNRLNQMRSQAVGRVGQEIRERAERFAGT
jgi:F-type H+-transporting ATPase subunit delta